MAKTANKVDKSLKKKVKNEITTSASLYGDTAPIVREEEVAVEVAEDLQEIDEIIEKAEEVAAQTVEVKTPDVIANTPLIAREPNVRVKLNKDLQTYIGDRWYYFKKGKVETVPQNVKEILFKAGMLDPL